jgi:hypothetical protein
MMAAAVALFRDFIGHPDSGRGCGGVLLLSLLLMGLHYLHQILVGKETIEVTAESLAVHSQILGFSRVRKYLAVKIHDLRAVPSDPEDPGTVAFGYDGRTILIGRGADYATGSQIVDAILQRFPQYGRRKQTA